MMGGGVGGGNGAGVKQGDRAWWKLTREEVFHGDPAPSAKAWKVRLHRIQQRDEPAVHEDHQ